MPIIHTHRPVMMAVHYTLHNGTNVNIMVPTTQGENLHCLIERICSLFNSKFDAGLVYHKVGLAVTDTKLGGIDCMRPTSPADFSSISSACSSHSTQSSAPSTPRTPSPGERRSSFFTLSRTSSDAVSMSSNSSFATTTRDMFTANGTARLVTPVEKQSFCKTLIKKVKGIRLRNPLKNEVRDDAVATTELAVPEEYRNSIAFATQHPVASLPYVRWCTQQARTVQCTLVEMNAPSLLQRRMISREPLNISTENLKSAAKSAKPLVKA